MGEYLTTEEARTVKLPILPIKRQREIGRHMLNLGEIWEVPALPITLTRRGLIRAARRREFIDADLAGVDVGGTIEEISDEEFDRLSNGRFFRRPR